MAKGNARGIFKLKEAYEEQLSTPTNWTTLDDAWIAPDSHIVTDFNFGYYCSGNANSRVDRLDYTADTEMVVRAYTYGQNHQDCAISSPNAGFMMGVGPNTPGGRMWQKINYSDDSVVLTPGGYVGTPPTNRTYEQMQLACGNANYGYNMYDRYLYKFDYSSDTASWVPAGGPQTSEPSSPQGNGGVGNQTYAYFTVGPSPISTLARLTYASDTSGLTPKGPLAIPNSSFGFHAGNANYGYWVGGGPGFTSPTSNVQRIEYASDTSTASERGNLNTPACAGGGTGNPQGMWIARYFNSGNVQKIDYSQDLATAATKFGHTNTWWGTGFGARNFGADGPTNLRAAGNIVPFGYNTGYTGGGINGPAASDTGTQVYRMDYDNDTRKALIKGPLTGAKYALAASGSSFGAYFAGGYGGPSNANYLATVDKIDYSNDTGTATPKGALSEARQQCVGAGTQGKAYVMGGSGGSGVSSRIDRIDFATDTNTATHCASLPESLRDGQAVASEDYAYFAGGHKNPGGGQSTVFRLDFSSDTGTPSPKGNLNIEIYEGAATGNKSYGYIMGGLGGTNSKSNISRINYSNDTLEAIERGNVEYSVFQNGATGNQNYGYIVGGMDSVTYSYTQRLDYSNDGTDTVKKGNLYSVSRAMGAASSRQDAFPNKGLSTQTTNYRTHEAGTHNFGYIQKGNSTNMMRMDMSSDSYTKLAKTLSTITRYQSGGATAGNQSYGYFAGGAPGNANGTSNIERMDYSNEGLNLLTRGFFTFERYDLGGIHNTSYGWFVGGCGWPGSADVSTVERLDYSNDQTLASVKGALSEGASKESIMIGNQNYGYAVGGYPAANGGTKSQRIDYSNDTPVTSPKGKLTSSRYNGFGTSTTNYGWVAGGGNNSPARFSSVERMDFSSDTTDLVTRGPIDDAGVGASTTGNSINAYLYGLESQNYIQKIDYSNDTRRAVSVTSAMTTMLANTADWYRIGDMGIDARSSGALKGFEVETPLGPQRGYPQTSYVYWNGGSNSGPSSAGQYGGLYGCKYNMDSDTSIICGTRSVYFDGGFSPAANATRFRPGATGNRDYSWWCAGTGSPQSSTIDRLDYSNDNEASVPRSTVSFSPVREEVAAIGNLNYGYYMGGTQAPGIVHSDVQRLDFAADTSAASPKGSLLQERGGGAAIGNQSYGYYAGGWAITPSIVVYSTVYRIDYSNDTPLTSAKGNLTLARWGSAGASHATDGYVYAGYDPATPSSVDTAGTRVDRINFANDTAAASPKSAMPNKMVKVSASGNGSYAAVSDDDSNQSRVFRMDYSNDMLATSLKGYKTAPFATNVGGFSDAVCSGENGMEASTFTPSPASPTAYCWFAGGPSPSGTGLGGNTIQRYDISNDTSTTASGLLIGAAAGGWPGGAAAGNSSYGYFGGGWPSNDSWSHTTKVDYANGFVGMVHDTGVLYVSMFYRGAATGNANYGYWSGGWNFSGPLAPSWPSSLVSRLDYSSDTDDCLNRGNMNLGRSYFSATGNQSYGYWAMGDNSGGTKVERLDYSSDTSLTTVGDLLNGGSNSTSVGNGSYGYWCYSSDTKLQRVDYSSDTSAGTQKGPLVTNHPGGQGSGNNTYGYFCGGHSSSQPNWSIIERLTYASDTTTAVPKGNLDTQLNGYCGDGVGAADYALPQ